MPDLGGVDEPGRAHQLGDAVAEVVAQAVVALRDARDEAAVRLEGPAEVVFAYIEAHYAEPISLADVAQAVGLSAGHLTTVVGHKTGRTVQRWITERRMAEARRLLVQTELTVEAVAARVGYRDPGYFIRAFRRSHGVTPLRWRRADRPPAAPIPAPPG